jgi:hypothetical protein
MTRSKASVWNFTSELINAYVFCGANYCRINSEGSKWIGRNGQITWSQIPPVVFFMWVSVCVCVTNTLFSTYKPVTTTITVPIMPDMPLRTWAETKSVWKSVELQTAPINEGRLYPHLTQNNYCVFYIIRLDDDHVERVRLRLWTAVTIGLLIIPQVIYEHETQTEENSWFVYQSSLVFLSAELSGFMQEEMGEMNGKLALLNVFFNNSKWFFACHEILRQGADGFTCPPKEGVLWIFIVLKNPSPRQGLITRALSPVASTLNITSPRRLSLYLTSFLLFLL